MGKCKAPDAHQWYGHKDMRVVKVSCNPCFSHSNTLAATENGAHAQSGSHQEPRRGKGRGGVVQTGEGSRDNLCICREVLVFWLQNLPAHNEMQSLMRPHQSHSMPFTSATKTTAITHEVRSKCILITHKGISS